MSSWNETYAANRKAKRQAQRAKKQLKKQQQKVRNQRAPSRRPVTTATMNKNQTKATEANLLAESSSGQQGGQQSVVVTAATRSGSSLITYATPGLLQGISFEGANVQIVGHIDNYTYNAGASDSVNDLKSRVEKLEGRQDDIVEDIEKVAKKSKTDLNDLKTPHKKKKTMTTTAATDDDKKKSPVISPVKLEDAYPDLSSPSPTKKLSSPPAKKSSLESKSLFDSPSPTSSAAATAIQTVVRRYLLARRQHAAAITIQRFLIHSTTKDPDKKKTVDAKDAKV